MCTGEKQKNKQLKVVTSSSTIFLNHLSFYKLAWFNHQMLTNVLLTPMSVIKMQGALTLQAALIALVNLASQEMVPCVTVSKLITR